MNKEFPELTPREDQEEFLSDWWSSTKLVRGPRQSGKTTMMLAEARRMEQAGLDVLFCAPLQTTSEYNRKQYQELFGEYDGIYWKSTTNPEAIRGRLFDAVIVDNVERSDQNFWATISPVMPEFVRASANSGTFLPDSIDFDSIYSLSNF